MNVIKRFSSKFRMLFKGVSKVGIIRAKPMKFKWFAPIQIVISDQLPTLFSENRGFPHKIHEWDARRVWQELFLANLIAKLKNGWSFKTVPKGISVWKWNDVPLHPIYARCHTCNSCVSMNIDCCDFSTEFFVRQNQKNSKSVPRTYTWMVYSSVNTK